MGKKQRDWTVELMRIIACLIVIGTHTLPSVKIDEGVYSASRVFLSCIFGDGVAIFWIITGFYLFHNYSYKNVLTRSLKKVLIPYLVYELFVFYFADWIVDGVPIMESIKHSKEEYVEAFNKILTLKVITGHSVQFWYVIAYMMMIVVSPILYTFAKKAEDDSKWRSTYIAVFLLFLVWNDFSSNKAIGFSHNGTGALVASSLIVIYGCFVYKWREKLGRIWRYLAPVMFVLLNLVRTKIQLYRYSINPDNKSIIFWYSVFGIASATLVAAFCFSFKADKHGVIQRIICVLGSYTFPVYVVHIFVRDFLNSRGFTAYLKEAIVGKGYGNIWTNTAYSLSIIGIIFCISLLICFVIRLIKCGVLKAKAAIVNGHTIRE